VDYLKLTKKCY